jgi:RHS repeat-associated protein
MALVRQYSTNSYIWDAENRLIQITYPGTGNNTQLTYDGFGDCVKLVETSGGSVSSIKQFIIDSDKAEARDGTGNVTSRYFGYGFASSGSNYFYTMDHLDSIREVTDVSGNIQFQSGYDPYGRLLNLVGLTPPDFQFGDYYIHFRSNLYLTKTRAYSAHLGRWISRDRIGERGGVNVYAYVENCPVLLTDPTGLQSMGCRSVVNIILKQPEEAWPENAPDTTCFYEISPKEVSLSCKT